MSAQLYTHHSHSHQLDLQIYCKALGTNSITGRTGLELTQTDLVFMLYGKIFGNKSI